MSGGSREGDVVGRRKSGRKKEGVQRTRKGEGSFALLLHLCEVRRAEKRALILIGDYIDK